MRRAGLVLVLVCAASSGCFLAAKRASVPDIVRSLTPPIQPEGVIVESVLIEQPIGDSFLNRGLWANVRPVGESETRALLNENGLQIAILSGNGLQEFQTLLASETDTLNPTLHTFQERKEAVIPTSGPVDPCRFQLRTDLAGEAHLTEFEQAGCGVVVRPEQLPDGRVKVWIEPRIQHGARQLWIRPNADGTQFTRMEEVPTATFPTLGCEAVLSPDDYLLIGWEATTRDSLGSVMFTADANGRPRQRVLVIRSRVGTSEPGSDLPAIYSPLKTPATATQAAAVRSQQR